MNREGGVFTPGEDDSSKNRSRIPAESSSVTAYSYGDQEWGEVMDCMQTLFAPFDVEITDRDPGDLIHAEIVVGGSPEEVQMEEWVGGVASFEGCDESGQDIVVENGIVFVFSAAYADYPQRAKEVCFTAAQEVGHLYGLDHLLTCGDPMTYLDCAGDFEFHDEMADCGEDVARECTCSGTQQNSYAHLLNLLGEGDDVEPEGESGEPEGNGDMNGFESGAVSSGCTISSQSGTSGVSSAWLLWAALLALLAMFRKGALELVE